MAARPKGFGLTRELEEKKRKEYDANLANKVCSWFNEVCRGGSDSQYAVDFGGDYSWQNAHAKLKDGKLILAVANTISPANKKKIQTLNSPFKLMENTGNFLATAQAIGVSDTDMFQTASLYEGKSTENLQVWVITDKYIQLKCSISKIGWDRTRKPCLDIYNLKFKNVTMNSIAHLLKFHSLQNKPIYC